ncbi:MAG: class I SAM-dependent methyltransferase [Myxococcota bacterium]
MDRTDPDPRLSLLRCPQTGGALRFERGADGWSARSSEGGHVFCGRDGVLDMAPWEGEKLGLAQRVMESDGIVAVYEHGSRPAITFALTGLTYGREDRFLREACRPADDAPILDLACGTGRFARVLARRFGPERVVAMDVSRSMLLRSVREARDGGLGDILHVRGDAQRLPFADASLGAVNLWAALHLMPDPARALREIGRVLRPGGTFTAFIARSIPGRLSERLQDLASPILGLRFLPRADVERWMAAAGLRTDRWSRHGVVALLSAVRER